MDRVDLTFEGRPPLHRVFWLIAAGSIVVGCFLWLTGPPVPGDRPERSPALNCQPHEPDACWYAAPPKVRGLPSPAKMEMPLRDAMSQWPELPEPYGGESTLLDEADQESLGQIIAVFGRFDHRVSRANGFTVDGVRRGISWTSEEGRRISAEAEELSLAYAGITATLWADWQETMVYEYAAELEAWKERAAARDAFVEERNTRLLAVAGVLVLLLVIAAVNAYFGRSIQVEVDAHSVTVRGRRFDAVDVLEVRWDGGRMSVVLRSGERWTSRRFLHPGAAESVLDGPLRSMIRSSREAKAELEARAAAVDALAPVVRRGESQVE